MYAMNMLAHLRSIRDYAGSIGARIELRPNDWRLEIACNGRYYELVPGFVEARGATVLGYHAPVPGTTHFSGWRLHPLKQWPLARDKRAFKSFCAERGIRTPRTFADLDAMTAMSLVKGHASSGGRGVLGPIWPGGDAGSAAPGRDQFIEEFVEGEPALAWYWDGRLAAAVVRKMARVHGDGRSTLRELVIEIKSSYLEPDWKSIGAWGRKYGLTLDAPVPAGQSVIVDCRYNSPLAPVLGRENALERLAGTIVQRQLSEAGALFHQGIPAEIRARTLFTLSAIVDAQKNVWFIDMNCNPVVHPDAYPTMLADLFGTAVVSVAPPPALAVVAN
jgi:hypothetical protein